MDLKNSKTAENLRKALAGESMARNKYTYFAQAARATTRSPTPLSRWPKTK